METFAPLPFRRLTKLYSDTKQSCDVVAEQEKQQETPELVSLNRKFRIQKDRLIAWGIEWSDTAATQGSIDESVAQAGLTETVTSVLGTIKDVLNEAERIQATEESLSQPAKSIEKTPPLTASDRSRSAPDRTRYEDLLKDLTSSIDILYDLSRCRRAFHGGVFQPASSEKASASTSASASASASQKKPPVFAVGDSNASELTLINPSTSSTLVEGNSPEASSMPGKLDLSDLVLPEEEPPPYFIGEVSKDTVGAPPLIGHLSRSQTSTNPWRSGSNKTQHVPVLVEYAYFDSAYRDTGVPPPMDRLESFLQILARRNASPPTPQNGLLNCLGYFEDPVQPRFGIVFELPSAIYSGPQDFRKKSDELRPASLLTILQAGSRSVNTPNPAPASSVPPLEDRFRMAYRIASEFSRIHSDGFLHKEVNSSKIMLFRNQTPPHGRSRPSGFDLRSPYFASFDLFSDYNVDTSPKKPQGLNIYRHPDDPRFTGSVSQPYSFQHDIYGLALVLIEIGLWLPLADIFKAKYTLDDFRTRLEDIWVKRLVSKCGTAYSHAVSDCLAFASSGPAEAFDASQTPRRLYRNVLSRLQRCCLLDEADPIDEDISPAFGATPVDKTISTPAKAGDLSSRLNDWQQMAKQGVSSLKRSPSKKKVPPPPPPTRVRRAAKSAPTLNTLNSLSVAPSTVSHRDSSSTLNASGTRTSRAISNASSNRSRSPIPKDAELPGSELSGNSVVAASIIQRAWRRRRAKMNFDEYRRKIILIQQLWRRGEASEKASQTSAPSPVKPQADTHRRTASDRTVTAARETAPRKKLRLQPLKLDPILLDEWHQTMLPRLERLVGRAVKDSPETISIDLVSVGDTPILARPTIFITCSSTTRVKAVLDRKFAYDTTIFDLKIRKGKIRRSKVSRCRTQRRFPARSMANEDGESEMPVLNPFHQERPLCGASIGAFKGEHLPPVSYGGVVLVDGVPLGLTVHHMLDQSSDDEGDDYDEEQEQDSPVRSMASRPDPSMFAGMGGALESSGELMPFEISDESDDGDEPDYESYDGFDSDLDSDSGSEAPSDASTCGDIEGVSAGEGEGIVITQPAIDDINEDFWGNSEDRDEDHLDSHSLGHIHASSGIRRWSHKGILHEIDWALLQLKEERLQPFNLIQGGKRFAIDPNHDFTPELIEPVCRGSNYGASEDEYPRRVAKSDALGGLRVHCFGRTTGLQSGVVGQAMSAVRIYRRRSFSRSWYVLGGFGFGGDSGAWVVDNDQSSVCGHVLARSALVAYICPMETILLDIKRTTNARRIALPGAEDMPVGEETAAQKQASLALEASLRSLNMSDIRRMSAANDNHIPRTQLDMGDSPTRFEVTGLTSEVARS